MTKVNKDEIRSQMLALMSATHDHGVRPHKEDLPFTNPGVRLEDVAGHPDSKSEDTHYVQVDPEGLKGLLKKLEDETQTLPKSNPIWSDAHFHGIRSHIENPVTAQFRLNKGKRAPLVKVGSMAKPDADVDPVEPAQSEFIDGAAKMVGQPNNTMSVGDQMALFGPPSMSTLLKL